jgi:Na+/proline symporter
VVKLLVGFIKGAVIGGGVGYGAYALAQATGFGNAWLTYGVIGALVGLFVGRPLWSLIRDTNATTFTAVLKAAFGFGIGCGLYALVSKVWSPAPGMLMISGQDVLTWTPTLGGAIGAVYGAFIEIDDAIGDDSKKKADKGEKSGPANTAAPVKAAAKPAKK